jgi:ABC-type branched-subunit amino acid transport system ATPase component
LGPVTVLAGRNAVGKTNILRAIQWAASTATSEKVTQSMANVGRVSLELRVAEVVYRYALQVQIAFNTRREKRFDWLLVESLEYENSDGARCQIFQRQNEEVTLSQPPKVINIGAITPCMPAIISLMPADSAIVKLIRPFLSSLERIRYYPLDVDAADADADVQTRRIMAKASYDEWLTRYRGTGNPGPSVLLRLLHMSLASDSQFQEVASLMGRDSLGLIDQITVRPVVSAETVGNDKGEDNTWYWFAFQPSLQPHQFSLSDLSAGTQRILRLVVSLIFDQSAVMLVEHPEDSIHRGLLRKLFGVLQTYSDQSQLIMSSHSSVVFDILDPKAIRLVTMEDGATKVRALTSEELHAAGRFMEEDGSFSDFIDTVEED